MCQEIPQVINFRKSKILVNNYGHCGEVGAVNSIFETFEKFFKPMFFCSQNLRSHYSRL